MTSRTLARTAAMGALLLASACAQAQNVGADGPPAPFAWLEGCWASAAGAREVWSQPYGDRPFLFGYGLSRRTVDGVEEVVFFEQLRIEPNMSGGFDYVATPGGVGPTRFAGGETDGETRAAFEDPEHDYPQRIAYVREGRRLTATISLIDGSNAQTFAFERCEAGD